MRMPVRTAQGTAYAAARTLQLATYTRDRCRSDHPQNIAPGSIHVKLTLYICGVIVEKRPEPESSAYS